MPGVPHHVTQRGNNRQDLFFVDDDRRVYLYLLRKGVQRYGLRVEAYCLMTNHVHIVVTPPQKDSLARALALVEAEATRLTGTGWLCQLAPWNSEDRKGRS